MIVGWTFDRSFKICFNSDTKSMQICNNQRQNTLLVYSDCEMPKTCIELFSIFLLLFFRCLLFYIPFGSGSFCDIIKYLLVFVEKCNKWKQRLFFLFLLCFLFVWFLFFVEFPTFFSLWFFAHFLNLLVSFIQCALRSLYIFIYIYKIHLMLLLKSFEIKNILVWIEWHGKCMQYKI